MYGAKSRGFQTKRKTKEDPERRCGKGPVKHLNSIKTTLWIVVNGGS